MASFRYKVITTVSMTMILHRFVCRAKRIIKSKYQTKSIHFLLHFPGIPLFIHEMWDGSRMNMSSFLV